MLDQGNPSVGKSGNLRKNLKTYQGLELKKTVGEMNRKLPSDSTSIYAYFYFTTYLQYNKRTLWLRLHVIDGKEYEKELAMSASASINY